VVAATIDPIREPRVAPLKQAVQRWVASAGWQRQLPD
jgi:hypothetical protein